MTVVDDVTSFRRERSKELRRHLGHLDALRGIAVLGVIAVHVGIAFPSAIDAITFSGQRGVQLFFIVSAFTLLLSSDQRRHEPQSWVAFYLRRFFRLAPMYYPTIVVTRMLHVAIPHGLLDTSLAVLFLQNLSRHAFWAGAQGAWSLGNEALFYLCFPLLCRRVRDLRGAVRLLAVAAPVSLGIRLALLMVYPGDVDYFAFAFFPTEFPVFAMGILTYFAWKEHLQRLAGTAQARPLSAVFLLLAVATHLNSIPLDRGKILFSSAAGALLLVSLSLYPWKPLVNRVTIFLGKISYSIYLTHFFIIAYVYPWIGKHAGWARVSPHHQLARMLLAFVVVLALASAVSTLTWFFIEEPGIRLGRLVIRRLQGRKTSGPETDLLVPLAAVTATTNSPDAQF